ncbi:hypothetical protein PHISP_07071 [Aspergillus sp. HF37]|nr:hypothetical protein PHISP_07071 [Aspergillus sp. HF37]
MPPAADSKKRKVPGGAPHPKKKAKKQTDYHSSSDEPEDEPADFTAVNLADSDEEESKTQESVKPQMQKGQQGKPDVSDSASAPSDDNEDDNGDNSDNDNDDASDFEASSDIEDDADSEASITTSQVGRAVPKRNDPSAFSTSISKILSTKLPTSVRADPVLSRSKTAVQAGTDAADEKLDKQARAKLRAERREELDRGRVRDVLGVERGQAGAVAEEEKRLRKVAQRGVVKLFNAVRSSQVRGEEAAKSERQKGTIGIGEREKNVNDVSKQGFLELISGKKGKPLNIEEA